MIRKIKGARTGDDLFRDVFTKTKTSRAFDVAGRTAGSAALEGWGEGETSRFQAGQDYDLGLAGKGQTRKDFVNEQVKESRIVGAIMGGGMTGGIAGVGQAVDHKQANQLRNTLFNPATPDTMEERRNAGLETISLINQSSIPEDQKLAAVYNIMNAVQNNTALPFSSDIFDMDKVDIPVQPSEPVEVPRQESTVSNVQAAPTVDDAIQTFTAEVEEGSWSQ